MVKSMNNRRYAGGYKVIWADLMLVHNKDNIC